jgi:hypothetical protein
MRACVGARSYALNSYVLHPHLKAGLPEQTKLFIDLK